ncbi:twin-arginine translocase TatA/TatE family subunit [Kangiella marina]|uniref:Sec-independent protein translocase protein TatA n=1 Tax=Kangiella marina TaxID=1079178 RepID=A0ABP8IGX8_9GAMM
MLGNISIWQLIIILVIILLLFGTKKLRNAGGDVGAALKNFKKAFKDENEQSEDKEQLKDGRNDSTPDAEFSDSKETENNKKS